VSEDRAAAAKGFRARNRPRQDDRCGACGLSRRSGHATACPSRWQVLTTAEQIADARMALMVWLSVAQREGEADVVRIGQAAAAAISARAEQLGLEDNRPGDWA
jgi:hypothetical protein